MVEIEKYIISYKATIKDSLIKINDLSDRQTLVLFVLNSDHQIIGSLTDGDVRRGFLKGARLNDSVQIVMNKNYQFLNDNSSIDEIKRLKGEGLKIVPLLDDNKHIIKFLNFMNTKTILPVDVVIMAGGMGVRLKPYTDDIPKPLLKLDKKPIIVHNIDRLLTFGINSFYISVNHMKNKIIKYLDNEYKDKDISISYIEELQPLGTIGSLSLVKNYKNFDILVINSDLLTNIDFEDFYTTYKKHNDDMSIASFNIKIDIPYAVMQTTDKKINSFIEKPTYRYYSNAGIYLIKKEYVYLIPENQKYDSIDFMNLLIKKGKRVTHFPIRGYWLDIGTPENYRKAQDDIRYIQF